MLREGELAFINGGIKYPVGKRLLSWKLRDKRPRYLSKQVPARGAEKFQESRACLLSRGEKTGREGEVGASSLNGMSYTTLRLGLFECHSRFFIDELLSFPRQGKSRITVEKIVILRPSVRTETKRRVVFCRGGG